MVKTETYKMTDKGTKIEDQSSKMGHEDEKCDGAFIPETNANEHHEPDVTFSDLDRGWSWMVLLASIGTFWVLGGNVYAISITQTILLERFNESVSLTSWAGALQAGLISIGGPISSAVVDRYSCRVALVLCGILYVAGHLLTAFVTSIHMAIFTYGIIGGIGSAVGYIANLLVVGFNFKEKRNVALGLASAGVGIGILTFGPIMEQSKLYYGSIGFFIINAGLSLHIVLFGVMCFPSKLEKYAHAQRQIQMTRDQAESCEGFRTQLRYFVHVLKNKAVIFLGINKCMHCFGMFVVFNHLASYMQEEGFAVSRTSMILLAVGITSIVGRIVVGLLASLKHANPLVVYLVSEVLFTAITLLFPLFSGSFAGQITYGLLLGLLFGNGYVLITSINIQYVGISYVSVASGFEFFLCGLGSVLGPVIAGYIVDNGGTYKQAFILGGSSMFLGTAACAAVLCCPKFDGAVVPEHTMELNVKEEKRSL